MWLPAAGSLHTVVLLTPGKCAARWICLRGPGMTLLWYTPITGGVDSEVIEHATEGDAAGGDELFMTQGRGGRPRVDATPAWYPTIPIAFRGSGRRSSRVVGSASGPALLLQG